MNGVEIIPEDDDPVADVADVETFCQAGLMTANDGLVVTLTDGTEFQVTIVRSR